MQVLGPRMQYFMNSGCTNCASTTMNARAGSEMRVMGKMNFVLVLPDLQPSKTRPNSLWEGNTF